MTKAAEAPAHQGGRLRILTYNVHSCIGTDRRHDPARIAALIASCEPDVVALQELDVGRMRTGGVDQAEIIARELKMDMHFHPAFRVMEEEYGDALLSALPSRLRRVGRLPGPTKLYPAEPRGALWATIKVKETDVEIVNTHLGIVAGEQREQVDVLLGPDWLGDPACGPRTLLLGDFNAFPGTRSYRRLAGALTDVQRGVRNHRPRRTFPSRRPLLRIDHIFTRGPLRPVSCKVVDNEEARRASDHLPLVADIEIG